ncbi:Cell division protein DivIC OS=Ureibacillus acetophenoni OX=614649 GN=SAMN05877842_12337 PE=4 SV=1 [Ureibacillus acetophenoni]|uniref:FtsB family cell division protein n=1 Tax=Ureibacillus sp. MALMAid1270 TaxID=3411629 RepID=UPI003BA4CC0D
MAKRPKQQDKSKTVRTLQNDYVRATDEELKSSNRQKILLRRRLLAFGIIASAILVFFISTIFTQDQRIAKKEQEKTEALAKLEKVKEQQEMLNLQIAKLEDDDYIAKLARKEYFLSDDGEIIFTIPDDEE